MVPRYKLIPSACWRNDYHIRRCVVYIASSYCGTIPTYDALNHNVAKNMLVELLGTSETNSNEELRRNKGAQVRLAWLREVYEQCCIDQSWECAARAYLLHLLGCTIFANKSATWVSVCYLALFRDLDHYNTYLHKM